MDGSSNGEQAFVQQGRLGVAQFVAKRGAAPLGRKEAGYKQFNRQSTGRNEEIMNDQPRFGLFAFWRTSATYPVRVALDLKGLAAKSASSISNAASSAAFLKINPLGALPALIDHQEASAAPLIQSPAILEFLGEIQPAPPLPIGAHGSNRAVAAIAPQG
jgi:hypothetical protein